MSSGTKKPKIENLLKEMVTLALFEQIQQNQMPQQSAQLSPAPVPGPTPPPPPVSSQANAPSPEEQTPQNQPYPQEELTLDSMIEKLNIIRGGKSFTDPEIYGHLTTYFKTLTPEAKATLDSFLKGVSGIMTNARQEGMDSSGSQDANPAMAGSGSQNSPQTPPSASSIPTTGMPPGGASAGSVAPVSPTGGSTPGGI